MTPRQAPGFYRHRLGDLTITIFSDGNLILPTGDLFADVPVAEVHQVLAAHRLDLERSVAQTNPVLIESDQGRILVDVGSGANFQPTAGRLAANMEAAGVDPADIDTVVITHAHPDHCWGLLDEFDESRFTNAEIVIGAVEWDYWMDPGLVGQVPEAVQPFVVGAQRQLGSVMPGQIRRIADGDEIAPGITALAAPGHTPGHLALHIESAGRQLLLTADSFNHWALSLTHPEWHFAIDVDKQQAVATRKRMLDMAATDGIEVVGYHMPWPGLGHIGRDAGAYRWFPAALVWG